MKGKIFNAQEVQAILNGSKVIFREVIKFSKNKTTREFQEIALKKISEGFSEYNVCLNDFFKCPYQVGQEIFCKESFYNPFVNTYYAVDDLPELRYAKWKPAQHMKQEHSRLTLLIKEIRVERLADISEEDCWKEGFKTDYKILPHGIFKKDASKFFTENWNATHKKPEEKFEASPFVWCINFEVINN